VPIRSFYRLVGLEVIKGGYLRNAQQALGDRIAFLAVIEWHVAMYVLEGERTSFSSNINLEYSGASKMLIEACSCEES
jgi:hypothetical protein